MLAVPHLQPMLRPARLIGTVTALRYQAFQSARSGSTFRRYEAGYRCCIEAGMATHYVARELSTLGRASGRGLGRTEKLDSFRKNVATCSQRFGFGGFRRRTPGPPPFSSMNSTPGNSSARPLAGSAYLVSPSPDRFILQDTGVK